MQRSAALSTTTRRFSGSGGSTACSCSCSQPIPRYRRLCKPPSRAVVALGKFEALHLGHRQLAYRAVKIVEEDEGDTNGLSGAFLLRLRGVHATLRGQQKTASPASPFVATMPLVASVDRARVLGEWTHTLADPRRGGSGAASMARVGVHECSLNFSSLRHLSPQSFVADVLHRELGAGAVVVGPDFRFGYKAKGDVKMLAALCSELSIRVDVIDVLTTCAVPSEVGDAVEATTSRVSSTRITESVQDGDMATTQALLGRRYRVVANCCTIATTAVGMASCSSPRIHVEPDAVCNLLPCPGKYTCSVMLLDLQIPPMCEESTMTSGYDDIDEQRVIEPNDESVSAGVDGGWRCTVLIDDNGRMEIIDDGRESNSHTTTIEGQDAKLGLVESVRENLARKRRHGLGTQHGEPVHLAIDFM